MIIEGTLVRRLPSDFCTSILKISHGALVTLYPPEDEICIVTSNPREKDLSIHTTYYDPKSKSITLKKAIEVIYNGKWYGPCDLSAFEEVKKDGK